MPVDQLIANAVVVVCFSFAASYGAGLVLLRLKRDGERRDGRRR